MGSRFIHLIRTDSYSMVYMYHSFLILSSADVTHFLIGSFIFLELSFRSSLYIFEINPLSVASFAIIEFGFRHIQISKYREQN